MINLLLGAPGGGKSYEATVFHILVALQKGRKVITNLPLALDAFAAIEPGFAKLIEIRTKSLGQPRKDGSASRVFSRVEDYADPWRHADGFGPLIVVDECHFALPKGETDREVEEWFSMHRHFNVDVLLITQSYGKISASVRDLVQMVYRVRKNVALGSTGSYTRKVQDGIRGEVVNTTIRRYEKRYFALYRSHTQGKAVDEFNASDVRPIWKNWTFLGAAVCALILVSMLATGKVRAPWSPDVAKSASTARALVAAKTAPQPAALQASPATPASSPHEQPQAQAPAQPASAAIAEPFAGRGLHLVGWMQLGQRRIWSFVVSQNGQAIATITDAELQAAGYEWRGDSQCSGVLEFKGFTRTVLCDSPQVGPGIPTPKGAAA